MATKSTPTKSAARSAAEARRAAALAKTEAAKARAAAAREHANRITKGHAGGFMDFVRQQGVVGLAVGLAIGTAAGASVNAIVDQFISPLVALMTRGVDLNSLKWVIVPAGINQKEVAIGWGIIISSIITLLATALIVYIFVKTTKLDRIDKKKES